MLTQQDLKQIRSILREEIESEGENTRNELQSELKLFRFELSEKIHALEDRMKNVEIKITKLQKDVSTLIVMFDKQDMELLKRVKKIEAHLGFTTS